MIHKSLASVGLCSWDWFANLFRRQLQIDWTAFLVATEEEIEEERNWSAGRRTSMVALKVTLDDLGCPVKMLPRSPCSLTLTRGEVTHLVKAYKINANARAHWPNVVVHLKEDPDNRDAVDVDPQQLGTLIKNAGLVLHVESGRWFTPMECLMLRAKVWRSNLLQPPTRAVSHSSGRASWECHASQCCRHRSNVCLRCHRPLPSAPGIGNDEAPATVIEADNSRDNHEEDATDNAWIGRRLLRRGSTPCD
jgi:hypothetical protein